MGIYINPPDLVRDIGRPLTGSSFSDLIRQLGPDERLVGLYNKFIFKNAVVLNPPWVSDDSEYTEFEDQYKSGMSMREGFFAVKNKDIPGL